MMKSKKLNGQRGFTLIELMIVVAIIGILAAVAIPKFADMLRKSKEGATKGSLTNLKSALTIYISDNEGLTPMGLWPAAQASASTDLTAALLPKYMDAIPTAKLGTYHQDSASIRLSGNASTSKTTDMEVAANDTNGWVFTSVQGGSWWVSCAHTDTKNVAFTNW